MPADSPGTVLKGKVIFADVEDQPLPGLLAFNAVEVFGDLPKLLVGIETALKAGCENYQVKKNGPQMHEAGRFNHFPLNRKGR